MNDVKVCFEEFCLIENGLPDEFEQCLLVLKNGSLMLGVLDKSNAGLRYGENGAFFDGIMGHWSIESVYAWKSLQDKNGIKISGI